MVGITRSKVILMKNHSKFATFTMTSSFAFDSLTVPDIQTLQVCGKTFEDGSSMATQDSSKPGGFVSWRQPKRGEVSVMAMS
jgi:hypothetical protein